MANLVLATIAIGSAVRESVDFAKSSLGGEVSLAPDMGKIREAARSQMQSGKITAQDMIGAMTRPSVSKSVADEIAKSEYVKDYSYNISAFADVDDSITLVEGSDDQFGGGGGGMRLDVNGQTAVMTGDLRVSGVNSYAFIPEVESGDMTISSGEYFDESTVDGVMISYDLAVLNDLEVGDKIVLTNVSTEAEVELKIVGIYDVAADNFNANTIYMNVDTAARFLDEDGYNDGDYGVSSVTYFMNNPEQSDDFIAAMNEKYPDLTEDNLALNVNDADYEQMVAPIEGVGSFANTILWVVVIASVAIITLMVTINVKDRRYEMGVLLSLGAKKVNVAGQILTELVLVGTVAFVLSMGTSVFLARAMGSSLLESQVAMSEQESENNFGRPGAMGGGQATSGGGPVSFTQRSNVEAIDEIDVSATAGDYVVLFVAGYLVIIAAMIIPTANVLRFEPKTILTGKE
jgi:putative ABC transport system permease protein